MSTQRKRAKKIKQLVDLYGVQSILLKGGKSDSCKHVPYDNSEEKTWIWTEDHGCIDGYK